jgi:hypothetical protein
MFNRWAAAIRAVSFTLSSMSSSITPLPSFTNPSMALHFGPFAFSPIPSKMVSMRRAGSLVSRDAPRKLHEVLPRKMPSPSSARLGSIAVPRHTSLWSCPR